MKRNVSDYLVALSVIACSIVLLAALTIALSGYRLKKSERTLQINYEDVTGVKVHSEVRYAGAPAGRVIAMRHLTAAERDKSGNKRDAVRVTISLDDGIPPLPADVTATLSSDTMLAPKFVALSAGTPGGKTLPNNAIIEGHPSYGIEQITAAAGPLFDNANKLIDNLSATVTNVNGTVTSVKGDLGNFLPKLSPLVDALKGNLADLQKAIQGLDGIEKTAGTFLDSAGKFIDSTDKQIAGSDERVACDFAEPESDQHARESAGGCAERKTKPPDFQRQGKQTDAGSRDHQKPQAAAGEAAVM